MAKKEEDKGYIIDSSEEQGLFNLDFMTKGKGEGIPISPETLIDSDEKKRKRGRPPKKKDDSDIIVIDNNQKPLPMTQSNQPYLDTYQQTNDMLQGAIIQVDMYNNQVIKDLEAVRNSKTLKNKYSYITDLTGIGSNLINTKITAIRELNKTITDSHNLELKRMKDLTAQAAAGESDEKYLMDMYNAFIQTPVGTYGKTPIGPTQMSFQNNASNLLSVGIQESPLESTILTPEQNRMRLESNPNIKTVVVLNAVTGERFFDVIDVTTGESVPNVPRPDPMFLEDTVPYPNENVARNVNLDVTYPLVVIGNTNNVTYY